MTAGFPDRRRSVDLIKELEQSGADVIELGIPFSDPIADGPVIQESSQRALEQGMNFDGALDLIESSRPGIPVVLFTYLNPLLAAGADALGRASAAGVSGVLVTDLPVGADPAREKWLGNSGLDFVRLVAPTTPVERMREIARHGSGFVYLISRLGVTGAQNEIPEELEATTRRLRACTDLPICVGFGVSTAKHASAIAEFADGIVVGSAIVAASGRSTRDAGKLVKELRKGLDA